MVILKYLSLFVFTIGCVSSNHNMNCGVFEKDDLSSCRPFRAGLIKLSDESDAVKPLASLNASGWTLVSDVLIGAVEETWIVGYSIKRKKVLWWLEMPIGSISPITSSGSWVIVGSKDGKLMKVEALTGKVLWEVGVGRFVPRAVTVRGSILLAMNVNNQLFTIDFHSGKIKWIYDGGAPGDIIINGGARPFINNNRAFIGTSNGEIHALDMEDGKLLWKLNPSYTDFRFHDVVGDISLVSNQLLLTRYDGVVAAIVMEGNNVVWTEKYPALTTSKLRDGIVYIGAINGDLYAVEAISGRRLWSVSTGQSVISLTVGEKVLYVAGTNGRISAVRLKDGRVIWNDDVGGSINRILLSSGIRSILEQG